MKKRTLFLGGIIILLINPFDARFLSLIALVLIYSIYRLMNRTSNETIENGENKYASKYQNRTTKRRKESILKSEDYASFSSPKKHNRNNRTTKRRKESLIKPEDVMDFVIGFKEGYDKGKRKR